jgi:light-regulated signal transduction histidine kinase (bacteriophytochrome)
MSGKKAAKVAPNSNDALSEGAARGEAAIELARVAAELEARLAERTIERDDVARADAMTELARTDAELIARLAERDDVALVELARTNAELKMRLAARTIERDDVARSDAIIELARTNEELKEQLARRTIERDEAASDTARIELSRTNLAEMQHRQHALELEALNAELESFSYSVSHDLRAPVRAVLGYAAAIREDYGASLDDEGRRLLSVVESEASRMGELIDDLLAFSRLGRQQMAEADVVMTALARDVADECAREVGRDPLTITVDELPGARGDRALLRQVWVNLISNAIKYSGKQPEPRVHVWGTRDAGRVTYHVRDNGVGFDMAYADKLFGVFQRLHRGAEFPGTGVGLAIVMRVVQRHAGSVWGSAELGAGATFSFSLPMVGDS